MYIPLMFLLESVEGGNKWSQYSIIGFDCQDFIKISDGKIIVSDILGPSIFVENGFFINENCASLIISNFVKIAPTGQLINQGFFFAANANFLGNQTNKIAEIEGQFSNQGVFEDLFGQFKGQVTENVGAIVSPITINTNQLVINDVLVDEGQFNLTFDFETSWTVIYV